jgi:hydroxylamine reductase
LIYAVKGISLVALEAARVDVKAPEVAQFACEAVFSTLTNVDFDPERFVLLVNESVRLREALKKKIRDAGGNVDFAEGPATFIPAPDKEGMVSQGEAVGVQADPSVDPDIRSMRELLVYGIKGLAAYADHARILGQTDDAVFHFIYEGLAATLNPDLGVNDLVGLNLKCGEVNLRAMELLDAGNTWTYGHPVPTKVPLGVKKEKAILG